MKYKTVILLAFVFACGCASVSKNPKDYSWHTEYSNGEKLKAYVEWFDDKTGCIGSALYVPEIKNIQNPPIKIVREKNGVEKEFHMCSEDANPDYISVPSFYRR